jgi:hypothetical protein
VSRSRDRGATVEPTALTDFTYALAADVTASVLYAATSDGISRSTDGGDSWTIMHPYRLARALLVDSATPTRLFAGIACDGGGTASTTGGVERSLDSGRTWTPLGPVGGCMEDLEAAPANRRLFLLGQDSLALSSDGGDTWQRSGPGLAGELRNVAVTPDGQRVFVASSTGLYRSASGGL